MSIHTEGLEQLKLQLRRLADVPDLANDELRKCAHDLAEVAKHMAPIDYGDLREAIQVRETAGRGARGRFVKGIREFEVFINSAHPVGDPDKRRHGVTHVGEYAWYVHEHMGWRSNPNPRFMPSDESVAAGDSYGVEAGGRFLERAVEYMRETIARRLARVITKSFYA